MRAAAQEHDYSACSGCRVCVLVCPLWRETYDLRMTPKGRAKMVQHGASPQELAESAEACTMCGACEPACPEEIGLLAMVEDVRAQLRRSGTPAAGRFEPFGGEVTPVLDRPHQVTPETRIETPGTQRAAHGGPVSRTSAGGRPGVRLLPTSEMRAQPALLARIAAILGASADGDAGEDLAFAIETGAPVPPARMEAFLASLRAAKRVIVADGLLYRHLRRRLPKAKLESLGEALSCDGAIRSRLQASDLYVIEPRAYHADHARLVGHYDRLRVERGCAMNLDLQRIAIPASGRGLRERLGLRAPDDRGRIAWLLKGRRVERIVVESLADGEALRRHAALPVVHLADLTAPGGTS